MLVGEVGPELVRFGRGGTVTPNQLGGGTTIINVEVHGSVASVNDLATAIRTALLRQGRSMVSLGLA